MKFLLASDSFKGCLSSVEVEEALACALADRGARTVSVPLSDGGEGMLDVFAAALRARPVDVLVHDPLMRPVRARYAIALDGTAVIETSQVCGLTLMAPGERDPLRADTYGVGELVAHAVKRGCRRFVVGLGGSGTSDAGRGMLRALVDNLAPGSAPGELAAILSGCCFTLACDVRNPLFGPEGAARVFGPQKGATPAEVEELDRRARCFAEQSARLSGRDASCLPGAGAAGGLGYAFMQYLGADVRSGADWLLDLTDFDALLADADVVVTGEGRADRQTLMGKLPGRVLRRAGRHGVPVWLVAGRVDGREALLAAGFARADSLAPEGMPTEEAIRPEVTRLNIRRWAASLPSFPVATS